jgi:hypothetical protein
LKNIDIKGRMVEKDLTEMVWRKFAWIHLAQDRDQWTAPVNMVMNLWVP